jgi:hypothetical protein
MRIVLHIGLHKTASTFLQWEVFSSFHKTPLCQDSCVLYNPKSLLKSLSEISYLENIYNGRPLHKSTQIIPIITPIQ